MEGASMVTVAVLALPPAVLPEAGETWHQVWFVLAAHNKVLPAVGLEIVKVWPAGVAPPETPLKVKVTGNKEIAGIGAGLTL